LARSEGAWCKIAPIGSPDVQIREKAAWVESRYFGRLDVDETAEVLQVTRKTVIRDWKMAKS
jgi:hypothetical protein